MADELPVGLVRKLTDLPVEEIRRQAFLFDEVDVGRELLSIEQDRAANKHTGTTLEKRQELLDEICMRLVEGVSARKIAKMYGVGRNTLAAIQERLAVSGKVEPYKKRVAKKFERLIEGGTDLLLERVENGDVPSNVLPVMVGIISDKKALLEGEPTAILGKQAGLEFTQEAWDRCLDEMKRVKGEVLDAPTDAQSNVKEAKSQ